MTRQIDITTTPAEDYEALAAREAAYFAANPPVRAVRFNDGHWVPACGGSETPFKARGGATLLYCWNPVTGQHAYLNVDTDMILSNEEAFSHLGH